MSLETKLTVPEALPKGGGWWGAGGGQGWYWLARSIWNIQGFQTACPLCLICLSIHSPIKISHIELFLLLWRLALVTGQQGEGLRRLRLKGRRTRALAGLPRERRYAQGLVLSGGFTNHPVGVRFPWNHWCQEALWLPSSSLWGWMLPLHSLATR